MADAHGLLAAGGVGGLVAPGVVVAPSSTAQQTSAHCNGSAPSRRASVASRPMKSLEKSTKRSIRASMGVISVVNSTPHALYAFSMRITFMA